MFDILDILTSNKRLNDLMELKENLKDIASSLQLQLVPITEREICYLEVLNFYQLTLHNLEYRDLLDYDILCYQILKSLKSKYPTHFDKLKIQYESVLNRLDPLPLIAQDNVLFDLVCATINLTINAPEDFILKLEKANVFTVGLMSLSTCILEYIKHSNIFGKKHRKNLIDFYSSDIICYTILLALSLTIHTGYMQSAGNLDLEFLTPDLVMNILFNLQKSLTTAHKSLSGYCNFINHTVPEMTELHKLQLEIQKYEDSLKSVLNTDELSYYRNNADIFKYLATQNWYTVLKQKKILIVSDVKLHPNLRIFDKCTADIFTKNCNKFKNYDLILNITNTELEYPRLIQFKGTNEKAILQVLIKEGGEYLHG